MDNQYSQAATPTGSMDVYTKEKIGQAAQMAGVAAIATLASALIGFMAYLKNPAPIMPVTKEGFNDNALQLSGSSLMSMILSLLVNLLFFYFLYRFSTLSNKALQLNDNQKLERGLQSLATYFKIWAIFIIMIIGIVVIASFAAGLGAAMK